MSDYNIPTRYRPTSASEFQELLIARDGMSDDIALDFTEQLMIFEKCGNVYARDEYVQAKEVGSDFNPPFNFSV